MSHNGLLKIRILKLFVVGKSTPLRLTHWNPPSQGYHYTGLQCLLSHSTLSFRAEVPNLCSTEP